MTQGALFKIRETRPLRRVATWKPVKRWMSIPLLECGHEGSKYTGDGSNKPQSKRCTKCAAFGADENGLKYVVPNDLFPHAQDP